jgi:hypothetical protein
VYADNLILLVGIINTVMKNTEALIEASKLVRLGVNIEKSKCMLKSRHQNAG